MLCMYVCMYVCMYDKQSFQLSLRNLLMLEIPSLAGFLVQGFRANLWGLVYCSGSSVSLACPVSCWAFLLVLDFVPGCVFGLA